jgi:hypothetical protein
VSDNLAISGVTIQALEMGLAVGGSSSDPFGIMGLGFDTLEQTSSQYPSIMDDMVSQGLISSPFYSLWLDDLRKPKSTPPIPASSPRLAFLLTKNPQRPAPGLSYLEAMRKVNTQATWLLCQLYRTVMFTTYSKWTGLPCRSLTNLALRHTLQTGFPKQ